MTLLVWWWAHNRCRSCSGLSLWRFSSKFQHLGNPRHDHSAQGLDSPKLWTNGAEPLGRVTWKRQLALRDRSRAGVRKSSGDWCGKEIWSFSNITDEEAPRWSTYIDISATGTKKNKVLPAGRCITRNCEWNLLWTLREVCFVNGSNETEGLWENQRCRIL